MSNTFNSTRHKLGNYWEAARNGTGGATISALLLKSTGLEAAGTIADYTTLATLLAGANDECDFTNYVRKPITGSGGTGVIAPIIDNSGNRSLLDLPDLTWTTAGGAVNNTIGGLLLCYNPTGSSLDSAMEPLVLHSMSETTNGNDLVCRFNVDGSVRFT